MDAIGAGILAQPDRDHLDQTALDRPVEAGVGLDPADGDDAVGGCGIGVEQAGQPLVGAAELNHVHGRAHRRADGLLGHAESFQHRRLPFRRGAAMAAHGRHDKGNKAALFQVANDRGDKAR